MDLVLRELLPDWRWGRACIVAVLHIDFANLDVSFADCHPPGPLLPDASGNTEEWHLAKVPVSKPGTDDDTVVVHAPRLLSPVRVRYCEYDAPNACPSHCLHLGL